MRILVCVKRVPAPGARIVLTEDEQEIDASLLGFAISPHEECAVEAAIQIAETRDGSVTVLTLGPDASEEQLRAALSVGATEAVLVATDGGDWDPMATARAITAAITTLEEQGRFDLILFGNESADSGGYQVGIRVARSLGRPIVSGIKGIEIGHDGVTAQRETPTGVEVYELQLPAVLAVREGINLPRYPTLKGRLDAKKQEVARLDPVYSPGGQGKVRLATPPQQESNVQVLGEGPDAAPAAVDVLEELGLA